MRLDHLQVPEFIVFLSTYPTKPYWHLLKTNSFQLVIKYQRSKYVIYEISYFTFSSSLPLQNKGGIVQHISQLSYTVDHCFWQGDIDFLPNDPWPHSEALCNTFKINSKSKLWFSVLIFRSHIVQGHGYSGLLTWLSSRESPCQSKRPGFDPWGWEDPLEKGMATHSSVLAWRIPWAKKPGRLQSLGVSKSQTRLSSHACGYFAISAVFF